MMVSGGESAASSIAGAIIMRPAGGGVSASSVPRGISVGVSSTGGVIFGSDAGISTGGSADEAGSFSDSWAEDGSLSGTTSTESAEGSPAGFPGSGSVGSSATVGRITASFVSISSTGRAGSVFGKDAPVSAIGASSSGVDIVSAKEGIESAKKESVRRVGMMATRPLFISDRFVIDSVAETDIEWEVF